MTEVVDRSDFNSLFLIFVVIYASINDIRCGVSTRLQRLGVVHSSQSPVDILWKDPAVMFFTAENKSL